MGAGERDIALAEAFAKSGRDDLESAEILFQNGKYSNSAYHSQQCAEKIAKALLVINGKFARVHIVSSLFDEVARSLPLGDKAALLPLTEAIRDLEKHWVLPRYPEPYGEEVWNPSERYARRDAEDALGKAKLVFNTLRQYLKQKYGLKA